MNKMTIGLTWIALGIIIMAIFGFIGNYYIQQDRTDKGTNNKNEIISNQDSLYSISSEKQDSILEKIQIESKELKQGQGEIVRKVFEESAKIQKPSIIISNSPGSVANTGDNVTINQNYNSDKFVPLTEDNVMQLSRSLQTLQGSFPNSPMTEILVVNNSPNKTKLAQQLHNIMGQLNIGYYDHTTLIQDQSCNKLQLLCNSKYEHYGEALIKVLSRYMKGEIEFIGNVRNDIFRIRICGDPIFEEDGTATFEE